MKDINGIEIKSGDYVKNYQADVNLVHDYDGKLCCLNHHAQALPLAFCAPNEIIGNEKDNPELEEYL